MSSLPKSRLSARITRSISFDRSTHGLVTRVAKKKKRTFNYIVNEAVRRNAANVG